MTVTLNFVANCFFPGRPRLSHLVFLSRETESKQGYGVGDREGRGDFAVVMHGKRRDCVCGYSQYVPLLCLYVCVLLVVWVGGEPKASFD